MFVKYNNENELCLQRINCLVVSTDSCGLADIDPNTHLHYWTLKDIVQAEYMELLEFIIRYDSKNYNRDSLNADYELSQGMCDFFTREEAISTLEDIYRSIEQGKMAYDLTKINTDFWTTVDVIESGLKNDVDISWVNLLTSIKNTNLTELYSQMKGTNVVLIDQDNIAIIVYDSKSSIHTELLKYRDVVGQLLCDNGITPNIKYLIGVFSSPKGKRNIHVRRFK